VTNKLQLRQFIYVDKVQSSIDVPYNHNPIADKLINTARRPQLLCLTQQSNEYCVLHHFFSLCGEVLYSSTKLANSVSHLLAY